MNRHQAGQDLTAYLVEAPHDASVFTRELVALVGELAAATPVAKSGLARLLDLYFGLRPHPLAVHFPVAYVMGLAVLLALYLVTRDMLFDMAAYCLLWMAVIMTPVAMLSGGLSWWFNHGHTLTTPFRLKIGGSSTLFILSVIALVLRQTNPAAFTTGQPLGRVYFSLVMLMFVCVGVLGWVGSRIAFPTS